MNQNQQAERLAQLYADAILRLSYTYLKNTDDAQDICQTVFVKLLSHPRTFDTPEHEKAYILRMAANACKDVRQIELYQGNVETHLNKKDNAIELYLENVEILLNKKDGTVVDMSNSGGSLAPENGKTVCVKGNAFEEIIPLEELESVSVGGITFPIPE